MDGYCTDSTLLISFSMDIIYTYDRRFSEYRFRFKFVESGTKSGRKL